MSTQRKQSRSRRGARGRIFLLESLEDRQLLSAATEAFTGPSLSGLISQAYHGKDTAQETMRTMLSALQSQLTDGPLADLNDSVVDGNGFISEAQSLVNSYNANVDQQLARFPHIDNMLKLQGQQVVANLVSLNQQSTVKLISADVLPTQAGAAINTLTGGPIYSLKTPVSAYVTATQNFETDAGAVADSLSSTASPQLTLAQASTTIVAEAEAYRTLMDAGLQVTHPDLSSPVNASVTTLENSVIAIASANSSSAQAQIHDAIAIFDTAILDTDGLFGLKGLVNQVNSKLGYVPHDLTGVQTATSISSVSGTAVFGGPATLTATLTSSTGAALSGKVVSFTLDGGFAGTAVTNSSGVATLTGVTQSDVAGTDSSAIVASFTGDSTNLLSQNSGDLVVSQSSTTTTLTSSSNPSSSGASVTFTAVVAAGLSGSGTPTGTVDFDDNGTQIGTGTLDSTGTATFSTSSLTSGTHPITAIYVGDTNFKTSTSSVLNQVVNLATTTTLTSSVNPSVFGQSVTFTATVAPSTGTGTPTGTVNFLDGTTVIASDVALNSSGVATYDDTSLTVATHSITAVYSGDSTYGGSTSTAVSQVVSQSATTSSVTSSVTPSLFGQSVTFTATVAAASPGTGTPTGTVNFLDSGTQIGTGTLSSSGTATFTTSTLAVGAHSITASYAGSTDFTTSTSSVFTQTVSQAATTTTLTSGTNPSVAGQSVTFTATVAAVSPGAGTPTGTVDFEDGGTQIGTGTLNSSGVATFSDSSLAVGAHSITAVYVATTDFSTSTSTAVSQTVNQASSTTTLSSSAVPSVFGQSVTFTATVAAVSPGAGTPTGTVDFDDGGTQIGTGTLNGSGVATFSTTSLTTGSHSITAIYVGDTNFTTSTSTAVSQTVNQASSTTTLASSLNPSTSGTSVTFTATVAAASPGAGTPTGTVNFLDNGTQIGTGTLTAGVATFATSTLTVGTHPITAAYLGDTNFTTSTSTAVSQVVTT